MYIGCNEKAIFIPKDMETQDKVISTLLKGIIRMINCLFKHNTHYYGKNLSQQLEKGYHNAGPTILR